MPPDTVHPNSMFVAERLPSWLKALPRATLDELGASLLLEQNRQGRPASWFVNASPADQLALQASQKRRAQCRRAVQVALPHLQTAMAFSERRLQEHLQQKFSETLDVHATRLVFVRAVTSYAGLYTQYVISEQSLLLAALHNFNEDQVFDRNSGLARVGEYDIEYVTGADAIPHLPPNRGDQELGPTEVQPAEEPYPVVRFKPGGRLAIEPGAFAQACRQLDLGKQYQDYLVEVLLGTAHKASVSKAMIELRQAELEVLAQISRLKGDIDEACFALLECSRTSQPLLLGDVPMKALRMSMLAADLHDVVVFMPQDETMVDQPCIAWLPGDPQVQLKRYTNSGEFAKDLTKRLRDTGYMQDFLGRVSLDERVKFAARLKARLWSASGDAVEQPVLEIGTLPWGEPLFSQLHDRHVRWLQTQGRCQAIPTAVVDERATWDRWEGYLATGIEWLGYAAFFVPALGPILVPVMAAQMMNELYHGFADLADGDTADGWSHLAGIAFNLGLMVAVHKGMTLYVEVNPFVESLTPVQGADGVTRLWNGDIAPYATDIAIEPSWRPNAAGLYDVDGVEYVALGGRLYLTRVDAATGERLIVRPGEPTAYEVPVRGGAASGWRHAGEEPFRWDRYRLLRRAEPRASVLDDKQLDQLLGISGIEEATLRDGFAQSEPLPWRLADLLQRSATAREVERVINAIGHGEAVSSLHPLPVEALTELPSWPEGLVLKVYEGTEPWGTFTEYGDLSLPQSRRVEVVRADFASAARLDSIVEKLGPQATAALLEEPQAGEVEGQVLRLRKRLFEHLQQQRSQLCERWHATEVQTAAQPAAATAAEQLLLRQFTRLGEPLARQIVQGATTAERTVLGHGRVPLRLAEQAFEHQRDLRLDRALLDCVNFPGRTADSQKVLMAAWQRQGPWNPEWLAELDSGDTAGQLADRAIADRRGSARALGQTDAQPWFRPPVRRVDGQVGYEISGRGPAWGGVFNFPGSVDYRLQQLYPTLNGAARTSIRNSLTGNLDTALTRLETEYRVLRQTLSTWADEPHPGLDAEAANWRAASRQELHQRVCAAWRHESTVPPMGNQIGFGLHLAMLDVGALPPLVADLSQVRWLDMRSTGISSTDLEHFLIPFKGVERLQLGANRLSTLPRSLAQMNELRDLDLRGTHLEWQDSLFTPLESLPLTILDLSGNPSLDLSGPGIRALAKLQDLRSLAIRNSQLTLDTADFTQLARMHLRRLDLIGNQIVLDEAAAAAFDGMTSLVSLRLANNPLGRTPQLARMTQLQYLNLASTGLDEWPAGLQDLLARQPTALRQVVLTGNPIAEVPSLRETPFATGLGGRRTAPILIDDLPLSLQSLAHLREINVEPMLAQAPEWMQGADATLSNRYRTLRDDAGSENLISALQLASQTADYRANPGEQQRLLRQFVADMTPYPPRPGIEDLRSQIYQIADEAEGTCGDGRELVFNEAQNMVQMHKVLSEANLAQPATAMPAVKLSQRLFTLDLLDEYAQALTNTRAARRRVIYPDHAEADALGGAHRPTLTTDPQLLASAEARLESYDEISDAELQDAPDEAEVRLKLRILLSERLDLPNAPQEMLYVTPLQQTTADRIAVLVEGRIRTPAMLDWLAQKKYWQYFLQRAYAAEIEAFENAWNQDYLAVYELSQPAPQTVQLSADALALFKEHLPDKDWQADDLAAAVKLSEDESDILRGVLDNAREQARLRLYRSLGKPMVDALRLEFQYAE